MKGKVSVKAVLIVVIGLLVIVLGVLGISFARNFLASAAGGSEPTAVSSVVTETSAKISWTTEKETMSRIQYGTTPASMLLQSDLADESEPKTAHSVNLTNLKPGQSYYFRIKTGEDLFDNGGIPYSFKTKGGADVAKVASESATPTVALLPTVVALPTAVTSLCAPGVDHNKDGATNALDIVYCNQNNKSGTAAATAAPTKAATCAPGVDYNKDGATNALDIVYCNQNNK